MNFMVPFAPNHAKNDVNSGVFFSASNSTY